MYLYAFNSTIRDEFSNWNLVRRSTYFFLPQSVSPRFFPAVTEFTPFPDFPLYKTLPSRLCHAAGPRSVNLSLPHSQAFVSDSRTQGWHCRGRVAEGPRREGSWRRGRLACTVFLAGGDGKGECRRVCELDRAADEIARVRRTGRGGFELGVVSIPEPRGRNRKGLRMVSSTTVVQPTTMAIASSSGS